MQTARVECAGQNAASQNCRDVAPNVQLLWDPAQAAKAEKVRNYDLNHALEPFLDDVDPQPATRWPRKRGGCKTGM